MRIKTFSVAFLIVLASISWLYAQDRNILFHEEFRDFDNWRFFHFPKIKKHTQYTIVQEGNKTYLRAKSSASASAIIYKKEFNVYEYPRMKWKWKIENVYTKGNVKEKSGDDYPMRVYVIFRYDPEKASFGQRIKYGIAKKIYGEYPPHSTLNYIWANRKDEKGIATNTFANEAKMIILESGPDNAGKWLEENIHIVEDYRKAFGTDPPAMASIAVMNESDNTGESSVSYLEYIEVYK
jgi:hypothetical protein